jgi:hypothetical protein
VFIALLDPESVQNWMVPDQMTITYVLADAGDGTDLVGLHENLPPGVPPADNELGWSMSIDKLARLVEHEH